MPSRIFESTRVPPWGEQYLSPGVQCRKPECRSFGWRPSGGSARILHGPRVGLVGPAGKSDRMRTKLFHTIVLVGAALGGATACSDGGDESGEDQQNQNQAGKGGSSGHDNGGTDSGGTTSGGTAGTCVQAIATPPGGSAAGGASGSGSSIPCGGWPTTK